MTQSYFDGLDLNKAILRAIEDMGFTQPTPIQEQAIPGLLAGKDVLGIAQTGTGKTAAFALPMLDRLSQVNRKSVGRRPRALILAPTRELAVQIMENFRSFGRHLHLRICVICGGVPVRGQICQLEKGVHVVVATPGRLLDLMNQGHVSLADVEMLVLDEADRMLDMGFRPDLTKIVAKLPAERQTALFSATMPDAVAKLSSGFLKDPVRVEVTPQATTVERIDQQVLFVPKDKKRNLLGELLADEALSRVLVFTRTKHGADRVVRHLKNVGVSSDAIHGNKSQNARQRALNEFRAGTIRTLVATDIAARGIDVDDVTHVINFELPNDPDSYVHRIGRTARKGGEGIAISFCEPEERAYLSDIEKTIRQSIPVNADHRYHLSELVNADAAQKPKAKHKRKSGQGRKSRPQGEWKGRRAA